MARPRKSTSGPKVGDRVTAYVNDQERYATVVGKEEDGKFEVFIPEGSIFHLTYREPADYDEHGAGGTFRLGK